MDNETLSIVAKALNTAALLVIAFGLLLRRRPRAHIPIMLVAFVADIVNVLIVEVHARNTKGAGAVEQTVHMLDGSGSALQYVHISTAVLSIVGYVVAIVTGRRLLKTGRGRGAHKLNAGIFLVTRLVSYVTSFWM